MEIKDNRIDAGKAFDWGRTSEYYAKYRDIYPEEFYRKAADRGLCIKGQKVLDLGTGTGVLPRNMYKYGAEWIGTDISPEQIEQAERLAREAGMDIGFKTVSAENLDFPAGSSPAEVSAHHFHLKNLQAGMLNTGSFWRLCLKALMCCTMGRYRY